MTDDRLDRVEAACAALTTAAQPVTFDAVAAHAGISRATLYRQRELRAVVEEHRAGAGDPRTLTRLAADLDHLRTAVEALAAKVRRHEETLRRLTGKHASR